MAQGILLRGGHFSGAEASLGVEKYRVVTVALRATRRIENEARPFAFSDQGLRVVGMAQQHKTAVEARAAALSRKAA
jgi:hypothetical protein